jgi:hypothetical protein
MRIGPNFTDHRRLVDVTGTRLCVACSWTLGGKPPRTLRMWTVVARLDQPAPVVELGDKAVPFVNGEHLLLTNRRDMRWVAYSLAWPPDDGSPWLVAVAESGKKHTAPFTPVNYGSNAWTVVLDGVDIYSTPDQWRHVLSHSVALRSVGLSAADVESGHPSVVALKGDALDVWRTHAPHLAAYLGTPLLHLANMMITRETLGDYIRTYPTN